MIYFVGLGNYEEEYEGTRHNVGRDVLFSLQKKHDIKDWQETKQNLVSKGKISKSPVTIILPQTYMNLSGKNLQEYIKNKKDASQSVVLHDDLDLGIGNIKLSYAKNSAGHRGVDSVIKSLKTKDFWRIRIGISPVTPSGKTKKVIGEDKVQKHVLSKFSKKEEEILKKVNKKILKGIEMICEEGFTKAMNYLNSKEF